MSNKSPTKVIVMSGQPGSGKSTLARKLGDSLRFIVVERDIILESYWQQNAHNPKYTKAKDGIPRYFQLVEHLIGDGIPLIIDGTLYKGKSESDFKALCKDSVAVNIHTTCDAATERFVERERTRGGGVLPDWVTPHLEVLEAIRDDVTAPIDMGMPTVTVKTDTGYDPSYAELVEWVTNKLDITGLVPNKP